MSFVPLSLVEATLSCWDAASQPVFLGCDAHGVTLEGSFTEVLSATSGRATRATKHVDEEHSISLQRTWVLRANDAAINPFTRGATYTLELRWRIPGPGGRVWTLVRTYTGVTWQSGSWTSVGGHAFGHGQRFRATGFTETAT